MLTKPLYARAAVFYSLVAEAETRSLSCLQKAWHGSIIMDTLMIPLAPIYARMCTVPFSWWTLQVIAGYDHTSHRLFKPAETATTYLFRFS